MNNPQSTLLFFWRRNPHHVYNFSCPLHPTSLTVIDLWERPCLTWELLFGLPLFISCLLLPLHSLLLPTGMKVKGNHHHHSLCLTTVRYTPLQGVMVIANLLEKLSGIILCFDRSNLSKKYKNKNIMNAKRYLYEAIFIPLSNINTVFHLFR